MTGAVLSRLGSDSTIRARGSRISPLEFVGSGTSNATASRGIQYNLSSLVNEAGTTPVVLPGDFVIVVFSGAAGSPDAGAEWSTPSGFTNVYHNAVGGNVFNVSYRFLPDPVDSYILLAGNGWTSATYAKTWTIHVFRNVDPINPLDEVLVQNAIGLDSGHIPNPPAITPNTAGSWVFVAGGASGSGMTTADVYTQPSDLRTGLNNFRSIIDAGKTIDSVVGAGFARWSSGSFDPVVWPSTGNVVTADDWQAVSLAIRPDFSAYVTPSASRVIMAGSDAVGYTATTFFTYNFSNLRNEAGTGVSVLAGDIVLVLTSASTTSGSSLTPGVLTPPGYSNLGFAGRLGCHLSVDYKLMGVTPDYTVDLQGAGLASASHGKAAAIFILRNTNSVSPFGAIASATLADDDVLYEPSWDPPSISASVNSRMILLAMALGPSSLTGLTQAPILPPDLSPRTSFWRTALGGSTFDSIVAGGFKINHTGGVYNHPMMFPSAGIPTGSSTASIVIEINEP